MSKLYLEKLSKVYQQAARKGLSIGYPLSDGSKSEVV